MATKEIWMVRAGEGAAYVDDFIENKFVGIGWKEAKDLDGHAKKSAVEASLKAAYTDASDGTVAMWASQIKRYFDEIEVGDAVTTYDPSKRLYFLGEIQSGVEAKDHHLCRARKVKWTQKVSRDVLTSSTRNSLGAISALFKIKAKAAEDMWANAVAIGLEYDDGGGTPGPTKIRPKPDDDSEQIKEVISKANDYLEDRIAKLSPDDMEVLVKEVLVAMGYRARVSPKGSDRGVDVFASPDGLGLQEPRIFVEVKHRPGTTIGSGQIRSFLGGRQPGDRCLYVSTGGFTKDAQYEAERSTIPLTLIVLERLVELIKENYDNFEPSGKALLPLKRLYCPVVDIA